MKIALLKENNKIREIYYKDKIKFKRDDDIFLVDKYEIKKYYVKNNFIIGNNKDIDQNKYNIFVDLENKEIVTDREIYHNFEEKVGSFNFEFGDNIIVGLFLKIEFISKNMIQVINYALSTNINLLEITDINTGYPEYPIYTTSPRYIKSVKEKSINLELPPEKEKKSTMGDIFKKIIPIILAVGMAAMYSIFQPRGARGVLTIAAALVTGAVGVAGLVQEKKENKKHNLKRKEIYANYLDKQREKLNKIIKEERNIYNYNDLTQFAILDEINQSSSRLYERDMDENGYLNLRIGLSQEKPKVMINLPDNKLKLDEDPLEKQIKEIYNDYKKISNIPYVIDLYEDNIGLVGENYVIKRQLHNLLVPIIFNHSYHDLRLIFIINEQDYENLSYFKWVKHTQNENTGLNTFIFNDMTRDQILNSYVQLLRFRDDNENQKDSGIPKPHFLFVISNYALIKNHPIMEFLLKDHKRLGFSLLMVDKYPELLPKNITTVIKYENKNEAEVILNGGKVINKKLQLEKFENNFQVLEESMRKIGQLEHIQGVKSSIPDKLGFLEMYNVEKVEDLNINSRWQKNKSYETLGVLLGKKTHTDYVELNLHEKAHGPHGLVAGTTGSGKSEVIQTYILSLALNYSPEEVGFLLIDYKGGGMANLFKDMPHHLGSITNLDGYQSLRALASIKSELKRRQKIFSDADVNHINGYHKLYEKRAVHEPLPHLFLISDEFAELKAEQPDFMKELVSAARIGRSLGVHLILATQKPSGVVDDQIWSNSKFKLSLKVAEEADSKELLKTADAAYIKNPGRGYLKVGNNELYELFQSGYSGGAYSSEEEEKMDLRIFRINENGSKELVNDIEESTEEKKQEITELDAVLEEITRNYEQANYQKIPRPWMPPLQDKIFMEVNIQDLKKLKYNPEFEYALVDLPNSQSQITLKHNLEEDGYLALFGGSGFGKSSTLLTIAMQLAMQNSPEYMKFFIFDFGNNALIHLKELYHTANYIKAEEELKFNKLNKYLLKEITHRKELFEKEKANNFATYNNLSDTRLPAIVVFFDNYDATKEYPRELLDLFLVVLREGASLGIYFITSFMGAKSARESLFNLFNQKVVMYTNDQMDLSSLLGRSNYPVQEIPGRMQVKLDDIEVGQIYYPFAATTEEEYINKISQTIREINALTNGVKNTGLLDMPEIVEYSAKQATKEKIYLGKEYEDIKDYYFNLESSLLIEGEIKSGKTNIIRLIIEQLKIKYKITIFDDLMKNLRDYETDKSVHYVDGRITDKDFSADIYVLNRFDAFDALERKEQAEMYGKLYMEFLKGKYFIIENLEGIKGSTDFHKQMKRPQSIIYIDDINVQNYVRRLNRDLKQEIKEKYDVYYIMGQKVVRVKPPIVTVKPSNEDTHGFNTEEKIDENTILIDSKIIKDQKLIIGGKDEKKKKKIINLLKLQYEKKGKEFLELELNIDNFKQYQEYQNTVFLINNIEEVEAGGVLLKSKIYSLLEKLEEEKNIVIINIKDKVVSTKPYMKVYVKEGNVLLADNIDTQKIVKVANRLDSKLETKDNTIFYIRDGKVTILNLDSQNSENTSNNSENMEIETTKENTNLEIDTKENTKKIDKEADIKNKEIEKKSEEKNKVAEEVKVKEMVINTKQKTETEIKVNEKNADKTITENKNKSDKIITEDKKKTDKTITEDKNKAEKKEKISEELEAVQKLEKEKKNLRENKNEEKSVNIEAKTIINSEDNKSSQNLTLDNILEKSTITIVGKNPQKLVVLLDNIKQVCNKKNKAIKLFNYNKYQEYNDQNAIFMVLDIKQIEALEFSKTQNVYSKLEELNKDNTIIFILEDEIFVTNDYIKKVFASANTILIDDFKNQNFVKTSKKKIKELKIGTNEVYYYENDHIHKINLK